MAFLRPSHKRPQRELDGHPATDGRDDMKVEATVATVSWIPSESLEGLMQLGIDLKMDHYDAPPPDRIEGADALRWLRDQNAFRFANLLQAWINVDEDGQITGAGRTEESGLIMGRTIV